MPNDVQDDQIMERSAHDVDEQRGARGSSDPGFAERLPPIGVHVGNACLFGAQAAAGLEEAMRRRQARRTSTLPVILREPARGTRSCYNMRNPIVGFVSSACRQTHIWVRRRSLYGSNPEERTGWM
jgi:hypothetical protein